MAKTKTRDSNLELFRIICMLLIVAHHYVGTSSLRVVLESSPLSWRTIYFLIFGMWGKTGINCFVLITGYFMCKSKVTLKHILKFFGEVYFYQFVIFLIFAIMGKEQVSLLKLLKLAWPIPAVAHNFVSCYILFYLTIPFLNVLVQNLDVRQHSLLLCLSLGVYSILGTMPIALTYNYVSWFIVLYFVASFIRLHPLPVFQNKSFCGWAALVSVVFAVGSVVVLSFIHRDHLEMARIYWFVEDVNKVLALLVAVSAFLFFKNIDLGHRPFINKVAATTFGVFLIHSQSSTMHNFLWNTVFDAAGHYGCSVLLTVCYPIMAVTMIFVLCSLVDYIRILCIEKPLFNSIPSDIINNNITK